MSSRLQKRLTNVLVIALSLMALTVVAARGGELRSQFGEQEPGVMLVQRPRDTRDLWRQVYELMPELPRENQYLSQETGEVDEENTLVSRLIRYHIFIKGRPHPFRLDWRLTLADYLGAYERMSRETYPGANVLTENPLEGDQAAISRLTRQERDRLVHVLTSIFNPNYLALLEQQANRELAEVPETPEALDWEETPQRRIPRLPQSGDAELLLP